MRKTGILIIVAIVMMTLVSNTEEKIVIPKEAIRFRVIANSDKEDDQVIKKKVAKNLGNDVTNTLTPKLTLESSRAAIKSKLPSFEENIKTTLKENNSKEVFNVNYGKNYFPKKEYKDIVYEEGEYESLVVTLGKGQGENFWCVLFPPLCLLEAEEAKTKDKVEYKSFVKDIIDKYFKWS